MKRVQIAIEDLMIVLEAMQGNGTTDIILFEYNDQPALADAAEPENIISFQVTDDQNDDSMVH